jgi:hypothetical protein
MAQPQPPRQESIEISRLRPTQLTVGMLEVKRKRQRLRELERRPSELVAYILETPIHVVLGPSQNAYVIDHHHLALALLKENFESAPMEIEADFSELDVKEFWERMQVEHYVHLFNAKGKAKPLKSLPKSLRRLKDDPYRSLAGFVRVSGGYAKTDAPFAEFQWADYFRNRIDKELVTKKFDKALSKAMKLAKDEDASNLPGYLGQQPKTGEKG